MPCVVNSCSINDDRFLWKCEFCTKTYHAACIGVQRHREFFITSYMVPVCGECQQILRKEADVRKLLYQQEQLVEAINRQTDANHRIAADLKKFCLVSELFDSIEHLLNSVKDTLSATNKSNQNMCSAVGQHIKSCDNQVHTTLTGISESFSTMPQKIHKYFDERLSSLTSNFISTMKEAESLKPHQNDDSKLTEILEEVKFVSGTVSNLQVTNTCSTKLHQTLQEELAEKSFYSKADHTSPGWRFLGNKWQWKQDWSTFDAKQRSRRLQEKAAEKARRNRKKRKQEIAQTNKPKNQHSVTQNCQRIKASDKELLATAKVQFAGPPTTTDHPIAALSAPKLINFRKGETINPYRTEQHTTQNTTSQSEPENAAPLLDPMRPPIVRLTEQSANGDKRYLKARLRDHKIMDTVRTFLAFLHDQPTTVCIRGITKVSASVMLAAEGLPTDTNLLREIFLDVHEELGISRDDALADLQSHRTSLSSERIQRLQQLRESTDRFYKPSFRK